MFNVTTLINFVDKWIQHDRKMETKSGLQVNGCSLIKRKKKLLILVFICFKHILVLGARNLARKDLFRKFK